MNHQQRLKAAIATNRFGMGAKPGELQVVATDPEGWLLSQLEPPRFTPGLADINEAFETLAQHRQRQQANKATGRDNVSTDKRRPATMTRGSLNRIFRELVADTLISSIRSDHSFRWRLLDFFSNHFSVSVTNPPMRALAPLLEREAIAPHLFGRFEDMLLAVTQHPAMLIYLNNQRSFGPDSRLGRRGGFNENLGREILELHTLGVEGGYNQADVRELALAITGWSVARPKKEKKAGFMYRPAGHQPGFRVLLGKRYKQKGQSQGEQMLRDLARHLSTAHFVSFKLAQHFVSDNPPKGLVDAMAQRWLDTNGDLRQVISLLVEHELAWQPVLQKFKSPREFVISVCRGCQFRRLPPRLLIHSLTMMGQQPFGAGSPAGFSAVANSWDGADALLARIDWTARVSGRVNASPVDMAETVLGAQLTDQTRLAIQRAESREQSLALLFLSPEFQRR